MTREHEALKLALQALDNLMYWDNGKPDYDEAREAITAIKEALAQSDQEPLEYWNAVEGWVKIDEVRKHFEAVSCGTIYKTAGEGRVPLYTAPPKREWVGLTDDEIFKTHKQVDSMQYLTFGKAIEAKLKEKNHD